MTGEMQSFIINNDLRCVLGTLLILPLLKEPQPQTFPLWLEAGTDDFCVAALDGFSQVFFAHRLEAESVRALTPSKKRSTVRDPLAVMSLSLPAHQSLCSRNCLQTKASASLLINLVMSMPNESIFTLDVNWKSRIQIKGLALLDRMLIAHRLSCISFRPGGPKQKNVSEW